MCMLYVKPENFTMPIDYLESLKKKNADGVAIYNKATGELFKTLNYATAFSYMEENHANELVVHFRFGTSGDETLDQLHGFEVCEEKYYLFHNGVLNTFTGDWKGGKSDTQKLVYLFRDEPVERLIEYLEKYEKSSRFLLVNKETKEFIIPKCATWSGDSTINGTHIIFSNSYAIDGKFLDKGNDWGFSNTSSSTFNRNKNTISSKYQSSQSLYDSLWGYDDQDDYFEDLNEDREELTIQLIDMMWKSERKKAMNFIKLYPDIAYDFMADMMEEKDIGLPF